MKLTVVLQPEMEGGYSGTCPAVPGAVSEGDTVPETLENLAEAIELLLEVCIEGGDGHPVETPELVADEIRVVLTERAEDGLPLLVETHES